MLTVCIVATIISVSIGYAVTHGAASVIGAAAGPESASADAGWAEAAKSALAGLVPSPLYGPQLPWELVKPGLMLKASIFAAVDFSATVRVLGFHGSFFRIICARGCHFMFVS